MPINENIPELDMFAEIANHLKNNNESFLEEYDAIFECDAVKQLLSFDVDEKTNVHDRFIILVTLQKLLSKYKSRLEKHIPINSNQHTEAHKTAIKKLENYKSIIYAARLRVQNELIELQTKRGNIEEEANTEQGT